MAKFACFLKKYAVVPYNKSIERYIRYEIQMAPDPETAARLNEVSLKYNQEIERFEKAMNESGVNKVNQLTFENIDYPIKKLHAHNDAGLAIQEYAKCAEDAEIKTITLSESFPRTDFKTFIQSRDKRGYTNFSEEGRC